MLLHEVTPYTDAHVKNIQELIEMTKNLETQDKGLMIEKLAATLYAVRRFGVCLEDEINQKNRLRKQISEMNNE